MDVKSPDLDEKDVDADCETSLNIVPIRGIAKSGRIWKTPCETRFSKIKKDKAFSSNWEKKKSLKLQANVVKELSQEIKTEKKRKWDEKRTKTVEKRQRKLENERKAEIVQVIKHSHKLKRLKKKQLRQIEKRDTN